MWMYVCTHRRKCEQHMRHLQHQAHLKKLLPLLCTWLSQYKSQLHCTICSLCMHCSRVSWISMDLSVWHVNGWMPDGSREAVQTDLNVGPGHPSGRVLVHAGDNAILHLHSACVSQRGGRPSNDAEGHCNNTSEPQSPALLPSTAHEKSPLTAEASYQCCRSSGKHLDEWIAVL